MPLCSLLLCATSRVLCFRCSLRKERSFTVHCWVPINNTVGHKTWSQIAWPQMLFSLFTTAPSLSFLFCLLLPSSSPPHRSVQTSLVGSPPTCMGPPKRPTTCPPSPLPYMEPPLLMWPPSSMIAVEEQCCWHWRKRERHSLCWRH
jgi:hypothetical protein